MPFKLTTIFKQIVSSVVMVVMMFGTSIVSVTPRTVWAQNNSPVTGIVFAVPETMDAQMISLDYGFISEKLFSANDLDFYMTEVDSQQLSSLQIDPRLAFVEQDSAVYASEVIVDDPYFTLDDMDVDLQWYLDKIKIPQAWDYAKGSKSVKVAIVDTGVHSSHIELNDGRIEAGFDVTTGKAISAGTNSDDNGHGTAVAGVIGAIPNNGKGVAGVNWQVGIMPIKALEADGSGSISSVAAGIVWAADNGAHIINLSLGGPGFGNDQTLNNAIIHAYSKGAVIIAAAGNDLAEHGINLDSNPAYPICADGGDNMVIGVLATDSKDRKANFSNYGVNCVDIAAPGKRILTTAFLPSDASDNVLIYGSGTSLATPLVSGVAALLKANNMSLTNAEIKRIILSTADNIDSINQTSCLGTSCNGFLGRGRLNALSVLTPQPLLNGSLVKEFDTGVIYYIEGGKKRFVSSFVFRQRNYSESSILTEINNQLDNLALGVSMPPLDGTLVKGQTDPLVYYIHQGVKRPLTYLVFQSRAFSFANVQVMSDSELATVTLGEWYWPPDGVMVVVKGSPTVYVMDTNVKRAVTYFVFTQRKLSFARVINVTPDEFSHIPNAPDAYWLPPVDGTLIKSDKDNTVYLMVEGTRKPVTYEAFNIRRYKFSNVKTLPQAEIDVISPGTVLTQ